MVCFALIYLIAGGAFLAGGLFAYSWYLFVPFDENRIGTQSIFRMRTSFTTLICDERFKAEFKQSNLTGLRFKDAFEPPFDKVGTVTALSPRRATIKPEGRSKELYVTQNALDGLDGPLKIGETVRVIGRRGEYGYHATCVERCRSS
jgi:hypothetical protein